MGDLRTAALVAGVLGQVAATVAGVLPAPLLLVAGGLLVAAGTASGRAGEGRSRLLRGVATGAALLLFALAVPFLTADRDALRSTLGLLLVGIQVVHALTWRTRRDLETALLIAAALLVLGASFAPDVLVGLPLVAGWAAVVAGAVLAATARATEGADAVASGGRRPPVLSATAVAVALGLAAFLLVPVEPTAAQRNPLAAIAAGGGGGTRGNIAYSAARLDLRMRGTLSERPVLEVPADSPTLWRSGVYTFYDGTSWSSAAGTGRRVSGPPWVLGDRPDATRTDRARLLGRADGTVWAPGEPVRVDGDRGPQLLEDSLGVLRSLGTLDDYRVTSVPPPLDPAVLRAATGRDTARLWLQLPQRLPDRVRALSAELTAGAASRYDAVVAVERWLRANATYRLDSPVPSREEDAVDRFLFVDRTGFCEQFAAAETVLLRAAGIPARLATGLAYGVPAGDGRRTYREKDLHAWVEVFYPGVGWSSSDPTAGVPLAAGGGGLASLRQRLATTMDRALRAAETVPGGRPGLAVILVGSAVGIVVLSRLHRPRRATAATASEPPPPRPRGPALAAFLRYDARLGERRRRPAESLAELAARLGPEAAAALAVVEAECYAASPPEDAEAAARTLDRLSALS